MTQQGQLSAARHAASIWAAAALLVALAPGVGWAQHHEHGQTRKSGTRAQPPKTSVAKGEVLPAAQRVIQNGVAVEFTVARVARSDTGAAGRATTVREQDEALVRLSLTDATTGQALPGLAPAAWIDRRGSATRTDSAACRLKVDRYVQASTNMEQALKARAVVDLNSYFVLALNRGPNISVLDPFLGFGRTKLYTTVLLRSEGEDWTLSGDQHRLYVTMPRAGQLAVIDTDNWKVIANVDAGPSPGRLALQPDERYLWVSNPGGADSVKRADSAIAKGGVTVVDPDARTVAARIATGAGPHAFAFTADSRTAFVLNRGAGTLTVVDVERLTKVKDIELGPRPVDLAFSPIGNAAYVIDEKDGSVTVVDGGSLEVVRRLALEPGLHAIRFAPVMGTGHGAHTAHAGHGADVAAGAPPAARLGFVLNPQRNKVTILDATTNTILRTTETGNAPDQVAFTTSFAYVRSAGSAEVTMIPLADPSAGGVGHLDKFPAGNAAPRTAGELSEADAIVAAPDMPDAVYVMNPKERMIYYFHYMEGMPIPSGGLTTYGFEPKAVLVAGKDLRETEPGVYAATIKLADRGDYDFIFLLDTPRVVHCFDVPVEANPEIRKGQVAIDIAPVVDRRQLLVGENTLQFRLTDLYTRAPQADLKDVGFILTATGGWRQRGLARSLGDGLYELKVTVPKAGVYYLAFEIPSQGLRLNDRPPVIYRASAPRPARAGDSRGEARPVTP